MSQQYLAPLDDKFKESGFVLFSGGRDSLATAIVTAEQKRLNGCIYVNTSIEQPDTPSYVKEICNSQGWPLLTLETDNAFDKMVLKYGFPSRGFHKVAFNELKMDALDKFISTYHKLNDKDPLFITGSRKYESKRRFGNAVLVNEKRNALWYSPLVFYTRTERDKILLDHGFTRLKLNPAYDKLEYSGDLCGVFAEDGERDMIKVFYDEIEGRLEWLEEQVAKKQSRYCTWANKDTIKSGKKPPKLSGMEELLCMNCYRRSVQQIRT